MKLDIPEWKMDDELWDKSQRSPISLQEIQWTHQKVFLLTWCGDFVGLYSNKSEAMNRIGILNGKQDSNKC